MALKFLIHLTLSVFVFSDKKTTRGHHRGLMLRSYSTMNRKTNDYDFWLRVDGSIEPCLQIIQASFDGYTAATIREVPNTYSMKECFFAKNYHENEFIDSPVSNHMTARFNITDEYEFTGAGQKCKDITQCATPHICAPEGKKQDLKCTNNKVGVLP
ncbi:unnamed protein product [Albugo candida]|uniref:Uncharacterized protein n=1 Tax=Albugo candida TaxID=65357 RepID=A0A024GJW6_9STRA|nr:unnamed protein product [Albugo candida]|eukprot:CCI47181.1 unnamed protein product [Albugo candida]